MIDQGEPVLLDAIERYLEGLGRRVPRANVQVTASGTTGTLALTDLFGERRRGRDRRLWMVC